MIKQGYNKRWTKWIILLIVIIVAVAGYGYYRSMSQVETSDYVLGKVEKGSIHSVINATGTINPVHYVDISTNIPGKLEAVYVKEGEHVEKGALIGRIDARELSETRAVAQAAFDNAKAEYDRYRQLYRDQVVSEQSYDKAVLAYEQAKANLEKARINVDETTITAPMSGTIVGTPLQAGQTISTGISTQMIIATIADLTNLEIYTTVDETDIGSVKQGASVTFTVDAHPGKSYKGYVESIGLGTKGHMGTTSNNVVYYTVKIHIDPKDAPDFMPSMTARVAIMGKEQSNTLLVPLAAVRTDKKGEYVYVMKDGNPVRTAVTTGITGDAFIQVLSGLKEGESIVVSGDVNSASGGGSKLRHPRGV